MALIWVGGLVYRPTLTRAAVCKCTHLSDFTFSPDSPIVVQPLALPTTQPSSGVCYPLLVRDRLMRRPVDPACSVTSASPHMHYHTTHSR